MAQANDSVSKNIQNQIANAQQKLQDLSSNEELSLEDKMKKRQEKFDGGSDGIAPCRICGYGLFQQ